ncbi:MULTISPECIES: DJ-1/PfpI family protein [unclassified Streptomyces]|uniref:DJ-1/PfpI family protein n=1 Tax=unclassified Streptomyces TaxID=2593676 RepID=UPI002250CCA8|nr:MULTISPECIES: DJ-1/PfpI family protein [unclassified Streptomyces]MCX4524103.1 DJ-1/PfpI family protein [Streptomyces sp. NBC_01551]MCX4545379.1 DJ-1/PfpI family protein [Streptomyces sp. NBC_01565]
MNRRNLLRATTAIGAAATVTGAATAPAGAAPPRTAPKAAGPLRVHVVMYDGVEELDFAAPYEVFSAARFFTDREIDLRYVTATRPGVVRAAYGTQVTVEHAWAPRSADVLLVPGGGYARRDSPGVWAEIRGGTLPRKLAAAVRPGLTLGAVCTGTMLLSAAGLTANRPCTTHHKARPDLEQQGGLLKNARVVDDGDLVTAGGITSGLDLALWLVRRELGADAATGVETMLEYEARGTVWTPPAAPRP